MGKSWVVLVWLVLLPTAAAGTQSEPPVTFNSQTYFARIDSRPEPVFEPAPAR